MFIPIHHFLLTCLRLPMIWIGALALYCGTIAASGPAPFTIEAHSTWVKSITFSSDGKYLLTSGGDDQLRVWHAEKPRPAVLSAHWQIGNHQPIHLKWNWDRKVAITQNGGRHDLFEIDLTTGKHHTLSAPSAQVRGTHFTDKYFAYALENEIVVVALAERRIRFSRSIESSHASICSVDVTADGQRVLVGVKPRLAAIISKSDVAVRLFDTNSNRELLALVTQQPIGDARFSPSGRFILTTASQKGTIWTAQGDRICDFPILTSRFEIYDMAANDMLVGTTTLQGPAIVETLSGKIVWTGTAQKNNDDFVTALAFSPDGKQLAIGRFNGQLEIVNFVPNVSRQEHTFDELWKAVQGDDASAAMKAVWRLASGGKEAVALLQSRLLPLNRPQLGINEIEMAIEQLNDDDSATREAAFARLEQTGLTAKAALEHQLILSPSAEVAAAVRALLAKFEPRELPTSKNELWQARAVLALDFIGAEAKALLTALSNQTDNLWLAARAAHALKRIDKRSSAK